MQHSSSISSIYNELKYYIQLASSRQQQKWEQKLNMLTRHICTQQIIYETQKRSLYFGLFSQYAMQSSVQWPFLHQVNIHTYTWKELLRNKWSINIVDLHPEWVGDLDSENAGRLGLWQVCLKDESSDNCQKQLTDLLTISSIPFQVSPILNDHIF